MKRHGLQEGCSRFSTASDAGCGSIQVARWCETWFQLRQPFGLPLGVLSLPAEPSEPSNVASEVRMGLSSSQRVEGWISCMHVLVLSFLLLLCGIC